MTTPLNRTSLGELNPGAAPFIGYSSLLTTSLGELSQGPVFDFIGGVEDAYWIAKSLRGEQRDEADMILLLLEAVAKIERDR